MKYSFTLNQVGLARCGLIGKVGLAELCLLDYLRDWQACAGAKRVVRDGREFFWLQRQRAVDELPLLLNPNADLRSKKNQLSRMVRALCLAGLVEKVMAGRDLYLRPSDLAYQASTHRERNATTAEPIGTPTRADTSTPTRADHPPTYMNEYSTKEEGTNEDPPKPPLRGYESSQETLSTLSVQAEAIYEAYPRKAARPRAIRAISKALRTHGYDFLLERTRLYASTYQGDPAFIPHPATWFNGERFNDNPETWRGSFPAYTRPQPKIIRASAFGTGATSL